MNKTELFVLDTNILISAFILPNSLARQALDQDLLTLDPFRGIRILSAKDFLNYNKE